MQVTIYRVDSGFCNVCDGLTVNRPGSDAIYKETVYELPEGFTVDVDAYGIIHIFDPSGEEAVPCLRNRTPHSAVCLVLENGRYVTLSKAKAPERHIPLRDARITAGLTQQELANLSGVNIRQIRRVEIGEAEAGNLTAKNLLAIADALCVDPHTLL